MIVLTDRQKEVMVLQQKMQVSAEVAKKMHLSPSVISKELKESRHELGMVANEAAYQVATAKGLITRLDELNVLGKYGLI